MIRAAGEGYAPGIWKELVLMFMLQQMQNEIRDSKVRSRG
jgi:hypothetical protein